MSHLISIIMLLLAPIVVADAPNVNKLKPAELNPNGVTQSEEIKNKKFDDVVAVYLKHHPVMKESVEFHKVIHYNQHLFQ